MEIEKDLQGLLNLYVNERMRRNFALLGQLGGYSRSPKKVAASRENIKKANAARLMKRHSDREEDR